MYELPTYVEIDGIKYNIRNRADYRTILGVIDICQDIELTKEEQTVSALIVFYENVNSIEDVFTVFSNIKKAVDAMMSFIGYKYDEDLVYGKDIKLIDWIQDEKLIVSAINNVAGKEIRSVEYCHWWTFIGYYMAIGESPLSHIVNIRDKIARGRKLEKYEQEFKRENPQYFRWKNKELEARNILKDIWGKKGGDK